MGGQSKGEKVQQQILASENRVKKQLATQERLKQELILSQAKDKTELLKQQERDKLRQEVVAEFQTQANNYVAEQIALAKQQMQQEMQQQLAQQKLQSGIPQLNVGEQP
jgi:hypothetical protein